MIDIWTSVCVRVMEGSLWHAVELDFIYFFGRWRPIFYNHLVVGGFFSAPLCTAIKATRGEQLRGCRVYNHKPFACPYQVCARGRARGCVLIVCEGRQVKKTRSKKVGIPRWKFVLIWTRLKKPGRQTKVSILKCSNCLAIKATKLTFWVEL